MLNHVFYFPAIVSCLGHHSKSSLLIKSFIICMLDYLVFFFFFPWMEYLLFLLSHPFVSHTFPSWTPFIFLIFPTQLLMIILKNYSFTGVVKLRGGLKSFGCGLLSSRMLSLPLRWRYVHCIAMPLEILLNVDGFLKLTLHFLFYYSMNSTWLCYIDDALRKLGPGFDP